MSAFSGCWLWKVSRSIRGSDLPLQLLLMNIDVDVPVDTGGWRGVVAIIPVMCMVVIVVIVVSLVATRERKRCDEDKEGATDHFCYPWFHNKWFFQL